MIKLWTYENHICELRGKELYEGRPSQLYTQRLYESRTSLNIFQAFISQLQKLRIWLRYRVYSPVVLLTLDLPCGVSSFYSIGHVTLKYWTG